jgi:hypothetical protein
MLIGNGDGMVKSDLDCHVCRIQWSGVLGGKKEVMGLGWSYGEAEKEALRKAEREGWKPVKWWEIWRMKDTRI